MNADERAAVVSDGIQALRADVPDLTYEEVARSARALPSSEQYARERRREEFNDRISETGPVGFLDALPPIGHVPTASYTAEQRALVSEPEKWAEVRRYPYAHGDCAKMVSRIKKHWRHPDGVFETATRTIYTQPPTDRNNGESHVALFVRFVPGVEQADS